MPGRLIGSGRSAAKAAGCSSPGDPRYRCGETDFAEVLEAHDSFYIGRTSFSPSW